VGECGKVKNNKTAKELRKMLSRMKSNIVITGMFFLMD